MKKFTKLFLVLGMVLLVGATTQISVFSEEPGSLEADLQNSMELIRTSRQDEYVEFYKKIQSTYEKKDLEQFKIIHLKYLYLTNSETEFMNLLNEFPDNYVFETYLQANKKKINFEDILKHKKKATKKDLIALWKKIREIDTQVEDAIQKDKYEKVLQMVGSQSASNYPELDNAYKGLEGLWAYTLRRGQCFNAFEYKFLKDKDKIMVKYLIENFNKHDSQENLMKLLKLDVDLFKNVTGDGLRTFDKSLYTEEELKKFFNTIVMLQKSQLPLKHIYYLNSKYVDFSYNSKAEDYIFGPPYPPYDPVKIDSFKAAPVEELSYISLSKDYIAVRFYAADTYIMMSDLSEYLIFKKDKTGWKPIIRHKTYIDEGGC